MCVCACMCVHASERACVGACMRARVRIRACVSDASYLCCSLVDYVA